MKVDSAWFMRTIEESHFGSQRRLAQAFRKENGKRLDQSALSRLLNGERQMQLFEAQQFAKLLDVPLTEVLARAGLHVAGLDDLIRALEFYGSGGADDGARARKALKDWRS